MPNTRGKTGICPNVHREKRVDKPDTLWYTNWALESAAHRGVEQLEARRAHNPEVVGSSPASATIIGRNYDTKS